MDLITNQNSPRDNYIISPGNNYIGSPGIKKTQISTCSDFDFMKNDDFTLFSSDLPSEFCKNHSSKKVEAFCETCREVLCIHCILNKKHKSHEMVSLDTGS